MTPEEINTIVEALARIAAILRTADPTDKAEVYRQLGLNRRSFDSPLDEYISKDTLCGTLDT